MSRSHLAVLASVCLVPLSAAAAIADNGASEIPEDSRQSRTTRDIFTYVGISQKFPMSASSVAASPEEMEVVAASLRQGIALARFDWDAADSSKFVSVDELLGVMRRYAEKIGRKPTVDEIGDASSVADSRLDPLDSDRILRSTYLYSLEIVAHQVAVVDCLSNPTEARKRECKAGDPVLKVTLSVAMTLYRGGTPRGGSSPYSLVVAIPPGRAAVGYKTYESPPATPSPHKLSAVKYQAALDAYRTAKKSYEQRLPELERQATLTAASRAAAEASKRLVNEIRRISDLVFKTRVVAVTSDGVEFMAAAPEDVRLDETFEVSRTAANGSKEVIGYVRVRRPGVTGDGTVSGPLTYAEKIGRVSEIKKDDLLTARPMGGVSIGVQLVTEISFREFPHEGGGRAFVGPGINAEWAMAPRTGVSELYASFDSDFVRLGDVFGNSVNLIHAMLGLKKKWCRGRAIIATGARGGVSTYVVAEGTRERFFGAGGDLFVGADFFAKPEQSFFIDAAGRFFTNPLGGAGWARPNAEMGLVVTLGVRLGL